MGMGLVFIIKSVLFVRFLSIADERDEDFSKTTRTESTACPCTVIIVNSVRRLFYYKPT